LFAFDARARVLVASTATEPVAVSTRGQVALAAWRIARMIT